MQDTQGELSELGDWLLKTVHLMVDDTSAVQVAERQGHSSILFEVHVAPRDVGKVIGKQGKHANAIRVVLNSMAGKLKKRVVLEIVEP